MVCSVYERNRTWRKPPSKLEVSMDILCAERVSKGFGGIFGLGPLDLHLKPGEILGIVGSEGTGKTTLLKLFWGFIRPDNGRISVLGLQPHLHQLQLRRK